MMCIRISRDNQDNRLDYSTNRIFIFMMHSFTLHTRRQLTISWIKKKKIYNNFDGILYILIPV